MRLIAAGVFVFGGLLLAAAILGSFRVFEHAPGWLIGSTMAILLFGLLAASIWIFNPKGSDPLGRLTQEEHLRELERLDLLSSDAHTATRAFGVEEYEDEGLHYFLELTDGSVLYLSGQYLYDF